MDEKPVTSTGLYFSVSGGVFLAEDSKVHLITSNTCEASEVNFSFPTTTYQDVKFAAYEGCFVVVPPNPPPPPPNVPPPPPPPNVPPPPPPPNNPPQPPTNPPVDQVTNADTIQETQNYVLESYESSIVVAGVAAAAVALFAIFGVVLGINNTKKQPLNPDIASMVQTDTVNIANENPVYLHANEIQHSVLP